MGSRHNVSLAGVLSPHSGGIRGTEADRDSVGGEKAEDGDDADTRGVQLIS